MESKFYESESVNLDDLFEISFYTIKTNLFKEFMNGFDKFVITNLVQVLSSELACDSLGKTFIEESKRNLEEEFFIDYKNYKHKVPEDKIAEFMLHWIIKNDSENIQFWNSQMFRNREKESTSGIDVVCFSYYDEKIIVGESKYTKNLDSHSSKFNQLKDQLISRTQYSEGYDVFNRLAQNFSTMYSHQIDVEINDLHRKIFDKLKEIREQIKSENDISNLIKCRGIIAIQCNENYLEEKENIINKIKNYVEKKQSEISKSIRDKSEKLEIKIFIFPKPLTAKELI